MIFGGDGPGKAEITYFEMITEINKNIFWFDIAMYDIKLMQVLESF